MQEDEDVGLWVVCRRACAVVYVFWEGRGFTRGVVEDVGFTSGVQLSC